MICKFMRTLEKFNMISSGDTVVAGVSGGADSMALLHLLHTKSKELNIELYAAHVNHCLRGAESDRDEAFVRAICAEWSVPLKVLRIDVQTEAHKNRETVEECGRRIRYDFFRSMGDGIKIATAHTLSDCEETFLLNFTRGAGLKGLKGIPPKRDQIIRPLLECSRYEIETYCAQNGIHYVTDSTNLSDVYTRNKVRLHVIPVLKQINPAFDVSVCRCMDTLREEEDYISAQARLLYRQAETEHHLYASDVLLKAHPALAKRVLSMMIQEKIGTVPEYIHVQMLYNILAGGGKVQITNGLTVAVNGGCIHFDSQEHAPENWSAYIDKNVGETPYGTVRLSKFEADRTQKVYKELLVNTIDCDKINGKLSVRNRRSGDTIQLPYRHVTKSLKKLFNELKIPVSERNTIPVLTDETGIVWVYGCGADARCMATETSVKLMSVDYRRSDIN